MYYHHYGASLMESKAVNGLEQSSIAFGHSVKLKGEDAESYNLLGVVESRRKKYSEAAAHFKQAHTLKPTIDTFNSNYATASLEAHHWDNAKSAYEASITASPGNAEAYHGLAKALEGLDTFPHDKLKEAIKSFTTATKMKPNNPQFQYDLCSAAFKIRDLRTAKEACEKGVALAGGYAPLHFTLGRIMEEAGGQEAASLQAFSRAAAIEPTNKQYTFAMRSASNAAGGGRGGLPPERRASRPNGQPETPSQGTGGGSAGLSDERLNALEARLQQMEEKILTKIRNLYVMTEALTEKLTFMSQKIDEGNQAVLRRLDARESSREAADSGSSLSDAEEGEEIKPHMPPDMALME